MPKPSRIHFQPKNHYKVVLQTLGSSKTEGSFTVFSRGKAVSTQQIKKGATRSALISQQPTHAMPISNSSEQKGALLVIDDLAIDLLDPEK